jgi:hypothetical protein
MDAKPASSLTIRLLLALCVAIVGAGVAWPAWDMFGASRRPMLQGWDDSFYYFWLPSVVIDRDVDFTNQLAHSETIDPDMRDVALTLSRTPTGVLDSKYPPGWALGSLPFFLAAHVFAPANATGFEPVYLLAVWLGQLAYAVIGLWLAKKILARYFPANIAITAVLVGWLTSPLVYYQTARLSMSHSQVFLLAMAVFWAALRIRDGETRGRFWFLLGFSASLLVVTRNVAAVYLLLPALVVVQKLRSFRSLTFLVLGTSVPVAVQLIAWKLLYDSWIAYSYGGERFDFNQLRLWEIFFSPLHGWFYWHPLMLVGFLAFVAWAWRNTEGRLWLISAAVIMLLSAAWPMWWLGSSFGFRGFEVLTFFVMIGLAVLIENLGCRPLLRRLLSATIGVAIVWNLTLLALFLTQRIPREEPVTYQQAGKALWDWVTLR